MDPMRVALSLVASVAAAALGQDAGYADPAACAGCHRDISETCGTSGLPEIHVNLGAALSQKGDPAAIDALRDAIRLGPDFAAAHYYYGRALAEQGRLDAPIEHYRRALQIQPNFTAALDALRAAQEQEQP